MNNPLDNMMWSSLSGDQRHLSVGTDFIRRFAPGFSPLIGFADLQHPDLEALVPFCAPDEQFYCEGWAGPMPRGWQLVAETSMVRMVWDGGDLTGDEGNDATTMHDGHVGRAMTLAQLTRPGPFGPRTIELGDYFAYFEGGGDGSGDARLMSMAGERMQAGQYREVSGVCTHPDFQGRGLALALMLRVIRSQRQRGQTTFLQVMSSNERARRMYERMGFRTYREMPVRVIALA